MAIFNCNNIVNLSCAVVVSFPRSGTHFTLDFLRRNFVEFGFKPRLWESSETLYVNLDVRSVEEDALAAPYRSLSGKPKFGRDHYVAAERANFLVKTHDLPFASQALAERLQTLTHNHVVTKLYPFRQMSSTLLSYHAHQKDRGTIREFMNRRDPFLGTSRSVMETMLDHGEWGVQNALPIDVDDVQRRPEAYDNLLAKRFGWTFRSPAVPLPPKRLARGLAGELIERLRGRQSSEIVIPTRRLPRSHAAFADNSRPLADLYQALKARALSPD